MLLSTIPTACGGLLSPHMTCTQGYQATDPSTLSTLLSSPSPQLCPVLLMCSFLSSRHLTSNNGLCPFLHSSQESFEETSHDYSGLSHPPHAWFFGFLSFVLTSHTFTALQLFLGVPVPSGLGGREACASLPCAVAQTSIVGLYLYEPSCQGGAS